MEIEVPVVAMKTDEAWNDLIKNAYWVDSRIEWVGRVVDRKDIVRIKYPDDTVAPTTLQAIYKLSAEIALSYERVPIEEVFRLGDCIRRAEGVDFTSALLERGIVRFRRPGCVEASGVYLDLLRTLDSYFVDYALKLGAREFQFPAMLPVAVAERCGILENYPQQVCSVHTPAMDSPVREHGATANGSNRRRSEATARDVRSETILSPAVCYHFWCHPRELLAEKAGDTYLGTAVGRCYRAEVQALIGLHRLQEFNMREILAVGDAERLDRLRKEFLEFLRQMTVSFELEGRIQTASDPFFVNVYAKKRLFQVNLKLKYEALAWLPGRGEFLAIASVNDHRDHFTRAFGLTAEREIGRAHV